jgi:lipopolysaccharide export system protein LptA
MKKIFLAILMMFLLPALCLAGEATSSTHKTSKGNEVVIQSDVRTFDIMKGVYDLQGNVFVQFPARDKTLTIKGDRTAVHLYKMEVHGKGNITLIYDELDFKCDTVDVYHKGRTAYVNGNIQFQHGDTNITADKGQFNWKTKLATFEGNVHVNGAPQAGKVTYNIIEKKLI